MGKLSGFVLDKTHSRLIDLTVQMFGDVFDMQRESGREIIKRFRSSSHYTQFDILFFGKIFMMFKGKNLQEQKRKLANLEKVA